MTENRTPAVRIQSANMSSNRSVTMLNEGSQHQGMDRHALLSAAMQCGTASSHCPTATSAGALSAIMQYTATGSSCPTTSAAFQYTGPGSSCPTTSAGVTRMSIDSHELLWYAKGGGNPLSVCGGDDDRSKRASIEIARARASLDHQHYSSTAVAGTVGGMAVRRRDPWAPGTAGQRREARRSLELARDYISRQEAMRAAVADDDYYSQYADGACGTDGRDGWVDAPGKAPQCYRSEGLPRGYYYPSGRRGVDGGGGGSGANRRPDGLSGGGSSGGGGGLTGLPDADLDALLGCLGPGGEAGSRRHDDEDDGGGFVGVRPSTSTEFRRGERDNERDGEVPSPLQQYGSGVLPSDFSSGRLHRRLAADLTLADERVGASSSLSSARSALCPVSPAAKVLYQEGGGHSGGGGAAHHNHHLSSNPINNTSGTLGTTSDGHGMATCTSPCTPRHHSDDVGFGAAATGSGSAGASGGAAAGGFAAVATFTSTRLQLRRDGGAGGSGSYAAAAAAAAAAFSGAGGTPTRLRSGGLLLAESSSALFGGGEEVECYWQLDTLQAWLQQADLSVPPAADASVGSPTSLGSPLSPYMTAVRTVGRLVRPSSMTSQRQQVSAS